MNFTNKRDGKKRHHYHKSSKPRMLPVEEPPAGDQQNSQVNVT